MSKKWDDKERALDRERERWESFTKQWMEEAKAWSALPKIPWGRRGWSLHVDDRCFDGLNVVKDDSWRKGLER